MHVSSDYNNIDHPIERSLLGTCVITLVFLIVSLSLFGPFIVLLVPSLIFASVCKLFVKIVTCHRCRIRSTVTNSSESYCPDRSMVAEETRWLYSTSKIIILMTLDSGLDLTTLRKLILTRLVHLKRDDVQSNQDSFQPQATRSIHHSVNGNELLYAKFSQKITKSETGWKWQYDENFSIDNHVHSWKQSISSSVLSNNEQLSHLISHINNVHLDLNHPPWDVYFVNPENVALRSTRKADSQNADVKENSDRCLIVFRIHPSFSDGVSLVHILCASLSDEQCPIELKDRFYSSGKLFNSIRSLFIGPVVFIQKWLLTRRDINVFHPYLRQKSLSKPISVSSSDKVSMENSKEFNQTQNEALNQHQKERNSTDINNSVESDRLFYYCTYPLSIVSRIKCVTRSTITEVFLAMIAGALRTYQQHIGDIPHPYDILCLIPTDLTKEIHGSTMGRNSSSAASKASNLSSIAEYSSHIKNNYSLVDFGLPTNTEGMIPRLWEVKQRMEELKNSADSIILCGLTRILWHLFPGNFEQRVMQIYYNKNSLSVSSLQGPDCSLNLGGKTIHEIVYWFPKMFDVSLTISCFTYADSFTCSVSADASELPKIRLVLDSVFYQLDLLNKLLEHRRIPGEHKVQRYGVPAVDEIKPSVNPAKLDVNEKENILQSLSPSLSSEHIYTRIMSIQNQLQNDADLSTDELDALRTEFSSLMGILRRRKSCGIDTNGESADFDEELEEISDTNIGPRRPSLTGFMGLTTRRRSLATSLARPLSTGNRSRSNSRPLLHLSSRQLSSNYLTQFSPSSSQRPSLRLPDDVESGLESSFKSDIRFLKPEISRTTIDSSVESPIDYSDRTSQKSSPQVIRQQVSSQSEKFPYKSTSRRLREDQV